MTINEAAIQLIALIKKALPRQVKTGTVHSVDTTARTCVVDPGNDTALVNDVRLQAVGGTANGLLIVPKVGSKVLYGIIDNEEAANYIVKTTTVDKIELNGNQYKGLVKVDALVTELNDIKSDLNTLKTVFSTAWVVVPSDGGAALKAAAATWAAQQLQQATANDLQNTTVTHG